MIKETEQMKKFSLHIYIALGLFVVLFIIGSIFDLQIMEAMFSKDNPFGLTLSVIGTIPGYGCLAVIAGMFLAVVLRKDYVIQHKKLFFIPVAVIAFGLAIFFAGREFFGENGFKDAAPKVVGYLIALPIMSGLGFLGYRMGLKSDNQRLWLLLLILMVSIFLALVPGVTLLKAIFHRPRYRIAVYMGYENFHPWWVRCENYKDIINASLGELTKEEFKSFPSGHAGASAVFMLFVSFLPLVNKSYEKLRLPLFYVGLAWCLFICWSRILVGAHFLSDVSMGGLITIIFLLIAYYVIEKLKPVVVQDFPEAQVE